MSMTNFLHSWVEHEETFCSLTTLLICCDGCVFFFFFFFFFFFGGVGGGAYRVICRRWPHLFKVSGESFNLKHYTTTKAVLKIKNCKLSCYGHWRSSHNAVYARA